MTTITTNRYVGVLLRNEAFEIAINSAIYVDGGDGNDFKIGRAHV